MKEQITNTRVNSFNKIAIRTIIVLLLLLLSLGIALSLPVVQTKIAQYFTEKLNKQYGTDIYVEDGLPPDGTPYEEGFKLPDVSIVNDGAYYRLNYEPELKIPARLYKFSLAKNRWIFVETDKRGMNSSHKPSQREILERTTLIAPGTKRL